MNDKSIQALIEAQVKNYMDKYLEANIRKNINERINATLSHGGYYKKIIHSIEETTDNIFNGKLDRFLMRTIKKYLPPRIIYVHEHHQIPPQLIPFAVTECFLTTTNPCIYFLCREDRIVYIGQSINLMMRLGNHTQNKNFDRVFYFEVARGELNSVEAALIEYYDPEYNRTANQNETRTLNERQRR